MGYHVETVTITVRLDAHGGEKERRDDALWAAVLRMVNIMCETYRGDGFGLAINSDREGEGTF